MNDNERRIQELQYYIQHLGKRNSKLERRSEQLHLCIQAILQIKDILEGLDEDLSD